MAGILPSHDLYTTAITVAEVRSASRTDTGGPGPLLDQHATRKAHYVKVAERLRRVDRPAILVWTPRIG